MKKRLVLAPVFAFFTAPLSLKRIVAVGLVLAVALVPFAMAFSAQEVQPAATWSIQTVDSAGWVGSDTSIALDSNNNPHISYRDVPNGDLKYARWTGSAWSIQTVDSEGQVGSDTSIALDSNNNPHISYNDFYPNFDLKYARWTGSAWSIETVDSKGEVGSDTSIALDSNNNPHISYRDDTNWDLKYARWTGSAWSIETVDSKGWVGLHTSIALDSADNPHISYFDVLNYDLKYARWTGSAWSIETVDSEGYVGYYTSIALDSADNPHISYCDGTKWANWDLKYARWTGSAWNIETVDSTGEEGYGTSIALDSNNNPHISYFDEINFDLKYAMWTGSAWSIETVDSTGYVGAFTSIALDSSDRPHISYHDSTNGDLKYARPLGYSVFSVSVNPPSQTVTAGDSVAHTVTATLLAGNPGAVGLSLDLPPSVGVYTFTPPTGTPTFTSTLIIHTHKTASAGTYTLNVTATPQAGPTRKTSVTLEVQACPTLTLDLTPQTVARGQPLLISGRLTPAQTATIQLYYRFPHRTGPWKLATTINTNPTGYYSVIVTVPASLTLGSYDLVAVWFNQATGTYAASPVTLLTVPFAMAFSAQEVQPAAIWSIQTVDSAGYVGSDTSIALDSNNNPHISYHGNDDLKYAKWTGSTWSIQTVDSAGIVCLYTSIALDSSDRPHISYFDNTNWDLKYARWTGSTWSIQTVDSTGSVGVDTSIALDSSDRPHISYHDWTNGDLKYARWTGSTWSIQTVDSAGWVGSDTSIALDSNNNPHISYSDGTNWDLKYARWTGSTWSIQTVDSAGYVGEYTSIALDSNNNPHISYHDGTNIDLKYARWTGSTWSIQTVDSAGWVGSDTSIALDSNNNPHISYYDWVPNFDLKYARWTGSAWSIQTVDSGGVGGHTSIALDSSNNPHISYSDGTNWDLKYARCLGYSVFSVSVNPPSQTVTAGDSVEHTVTVTLLAGNPGTVSLSLDLPPSVGVYTFTPPTGTPTFTSTLIIHTHKTAPAGTYTLNVIATPEVGVTRKTSITLEVQACPTLTLDLTPKTVARGQPLLISGRLTPAQAATIRLYYRFPHRTGPWKLATTINTNPTGYYSVIVTVPASLTPGSYDLVAVWFNQRPGTYAASPVTLLTVT